MIHITNELNLFIIHHFTSKGQFSIKKYKFAEKYT